MPSADQTDNVRRSYRNGGVAEERLDDLSETERSIVTWVCLGLKNRQIAQLLDLSDTQVKEHLKSIFAKVLVVDRLELIIYAFGHGLNPRHHID